MSSIKDKPGRRIRLVTLRDRERGMVHIIRNLSNTRGFLQDSGNMGWMTIDEWKAFLQKELADITSGGTLFEEFSRMESKRS